MASITFSDDYPHEASFICYLNGIEVPVQSVEVHMAVNTNPTATVTMVPDPIIQRIGAEDQLELAVFYLDDIYSDLRKKGNAPDFRLLYEGKITGWSYVNSAGGRHIGLNARGFLDLLHKLTPQFICGPESLALAAFTPPTGNNATFVTNQMNFPWNMFFYGFDSTNTKLIQRPYDIIMNVIKACSGVSEQALLGSVVTTNFYARYMRRIAFANRFLPSPIIETDILSLGDVTGVFPILRAVRDTMVVDVLRRGASQFGVDVSVWATIQQMFLQMYYETLCITTAPIAQVDRTPDSTSNGVVLGGPKFRITTDSQKETEIRRKMSEELEKDIQAAIARAELNLIVTLGEDHPDFQVTLNEKEVEIRKAYESLLPQKPNDAQKPNCILNYVTKPQWLFGVAPSCNIIFPSMLREVRYNEDYERQPTRLYVNDMWYAELTGTNNPAQQAMATLRAGYPEQVQRELEKRYGIAAAGVSGNPGVSGKNFIVWPEEFYKGPVSESVRFPNWFEMLAQYVQTKQTTEQKRASEALKEIEALALRGESLDAKVQELINQGILPPEVEAQQSKKGSAYKGRAYTVTTVREILRKLSSEKNATIDVLRRGYARYEYYRKRMTYRSGTAITAFNPYIVPGFPTFIFDDLVTGCHLVGYVVSVTHSLSSESWTTQINFTYAQTLDDFMQELFDAKVGNTVHGVLPNQAAAPVHPVDSLREVLQEQEHAEDYFSLLFHQRANYTGVKSCAFDFDRVIRLVLPSDEAYPFSSAIESEIVGKEIARRLDQEENEAAEFDRKLADYAANIRTTIMEQWKDAWTTLDANTRRNIENEIDAKIQSYEQQLLDDIAAKQAELLALAPEAGLPSDLLQKYVAVKPSNEFAAMFRSHEEAMRFVSRPICTLDEYIAFRGKFGAKSGKILPTDPSQGKGAVFYEKILNLRQGPGEAPTFDNNNNLLTPEIAQMPDTRADWETRLKIYRQKLIFKRAGWRPD